MIGIYASGVITCNNHVIHIKENKSDTSESLAKEESLIIRTKSEPLLSNHKTKLSKPSSRSLLKAIKSTTKMKNLILRIRVASRWLHVDFLEKITIEKCIFHIHLKQRPMKNSNNCK
jgi:hypothetical protein